MQHFTGYTLENKARCFVKRKILQKTLKKGFLRELKICIDASFLRV